MEEIYGQMYEESSPPARYPQEVKSYEDHYLSSERQVEIINEICKLRRVAGRDKRMVEQAVHLGCCPNTTPVYRKERVI